MQKVFAYALCAGIASILAVIYTLLRIDWKEPPPGERDVPAAAAPAGSPDSPPVDRR